MANRSAALAPVLLLLVGPAGADEALRFDFEHGPSPWVSTAGRGVEVRASGEPARGRVLVLTPDGDDVLALLPETAAWPGVRVTGRFLFPEAVDAYLGFVYNHRRRGAREDFGVLYVKNDGYAQANPHRDRGVGRLLYPEFQATLTGPSAIHVGSWQTFRFEAVGPMAHLYVGDVAEPVMAFDLFEGERGAFGLQPRSVGGPVWVDDVEARPIDRLAWTGGARPPSAADPSPALLRAWEVAGPLESTNDALARGEGPAGAWRPFDADPRGAVVTARVTDYHGPRTVAYFRARLAAEAAGEAVLHFSTVDDLALWVNGRFAWFVPRGSAAWWDFRTNAAHAGRRIPVTLRAGPNEIVVRVRGGAYASGGFYAALEAATGSGQR